MKTLQEIKNEYAQEQGYDDWQAFVYEYGEENPDWHDYGQAHPNNFHKHMDEICIRAQKVALEMAAENVKMLATDFNCDCGQTHTDWNVNKESITNPENLIR